MAIVLLGIQDESGVKPGDGSDSGDRRDRGRKVGKRVGWERMI